jgi:hypothetical protein
MLFAAHLDNKYDYANLGASLHARTRHGLPCPKDKKRGQDPGRWMLVH